MASWELGVRVCTQISAQEISIKFNITITAFQSHLENVLTGSKNKNETWKQGLWSDFAG